MKKIVIGTLGVLMALVLTGCGGGYNYDAVPEVDPKDKNGLEPGKCFVIQRVEYGKGISFTNHVYGIGRYCKVEGKSESK